MAGTRTIEVTLPEAVGTTPDDVELLQGIFEAIAALRCPSRETGAEVERTLAQAGWVVRARLMWVAEARRAGEYQEVSGGTRADALKHLEQLVRADQVLSPP